MGSKAESASKLAGKLPPASSGSENKMFGMKRFSGLKGLKKEKNSGQGTPSHECESSVSAHGGDGDGGSIPLEAQTLSPSMTPSLVPTDYAAIHPVSGHENKPVLSDQNKDQFGDYLASSSKSSSSSQNNAGGKFTARSARRNMKMPLSMPGHQRQGSKAGDTNKENAGPEEGGRLENLGSLSPNRFGFKIRSQPLGSNEGEASNAKSLGSPKGFPNSTKGSGSDKRKAKKEEVYIFLTDTKLERYRRLFYMYATSASKETGEPLMNEKGLQKFIKHIGATRADSEALMKKFAKATDDSISFSELTSYLEDVSAGENTAEDVEIIFDYVLGKDRDQTITYDRFRSLLIGFNNGCSAFTEDDIRKVFRKIDSDENGSVTREEVQAFMSSMLAQ